MTHDKLTDQYVELRVQMLLGEFFLVCENKTAEQIILVAQEYSDKIIKMIEEIK